MSQDLERSYPVSRTILGLTQAAGWILAAIGVIAGSIAIGAVINMEVDSPGRKANIVQGLFVIVASLFAGGINHALIAIGLAIFDLVEVQKQALAEHVQGTGYLRDILTNVGGRDAQPDPASTSPIAEPKPVPAPMPIPIMVPKDGTTLLEPHVPEVVPTKPLVITGDLPPSKPLGEADIERLEAENRRRSLPKP